MKKLNLFLIVMMFVGGALLYPYLPSEVPMHWNIRGNVDRYMPKNNALWAIPILTSAVFLLFQILPYFDPNKKKYKLFKKEWEIMQTAIIAFFVYIHFLTFYISINPKVQLMPLMFIGLGTLFILLGNYMSKIRQNYFIGIKLPWTLSSEENWNKTHRFASWCFVIAGIITLVEAYFIWYAPFVIFAGIFLAAILPAIYSFLLFKKSEHKMKYIYIFLLIAAGIILSLRLFSKEDDWICVGGHWVKHGNPSFSAPKVPCVLKR